MYSAALMILADPLWVAQSPVAAMRDFVHCHCCHSCTRSTLARMVLHRCRSVLAILLAALRTALRSSACWWLRWSPAMSLRMARCDALPALRWSRRPSRCTGCGVGSKRALHRVLAQASLPSVRRRADRGVASLLHCCIRASLHCMLHRCIVAPLQRRSLR